MRTRARVSFILDFILEAGNVYTSRLASYCTCIRGNVFLLYSVLFRFKLSCSYRALVFRVCSLKIINILNKNVSIASSKQMNVYFRLFPFIADSINTNDEAFNNCIGKMKFEDSRTNKRYILIF